MPDISAEEIADELRKSGVVGYEVALVRKDQYIAELEAALRDALDYIDDPSDPSREVLGPTLIVLAGRRLLERK